MPYKTFKSEIKNNEEIELLGLKLKNITFPKISKQLGSNHDTRLEKYFPNKFKFYDIRDDVKVADITRMANEILKHQIDVVWPLIKNKNE